MPEAYKIFPLRASPGIKRDGTNTEGNYWNQGQWVRFYRGLPRSMGGYRSMTNEFPGVSRALFANANGNGYFSIFSASATNLSVGLFTTGGFGSGITNITPVGFAANSANIWQLDSFYNQNGGNVTDLVAHAAPNLVDIASNTAAQVYYGNITSTSTLTGSVDDSGNPLEVSGGIVALSAFTVAYGSYGLVRVSNEGDPSTFPVAQSYNPVPTKIVKGLAIQNSSYPPSALLWSIDSLIQMSFVGGDVIWDFNIISDQSSVLSSSAMVEFDGVYYWPGIDRFLTFYNGTLQELPNEMNLDFFYSNLNYTYRQKVFGYKIPRWGEIVWCAPLFGATEPNWAIIYNKRENTWYDTPLPSDGRSAAYFAQAWQYPILAGANQLQSAYQIWQHEYGTDELIGNQDNAIQCFIESPTLSIVGGGLTILGNAAFTPDDVWTQLVGFEGDFILGNSITVTFIGRAHAMDSDIILETDTITSVSNNFDIQQQTRYLRIQIDCNSQNGSFIMGTPYLMYRLGDRNPR